MDSKLLITLLFALCVSLVSCYDFEAHNEQESLREAERKLREDDKYSALFKATDLIGTTPKGADESLIVQKSSALVLAEIYRWTKVKGFTQHLKFNHLYKHKYLQPCDHILPLYFEYDDLIEKGLEHNDPTARSIKRATKFCEFVTSKGSDSTVYHEFKKQISHPVDM